MSSTRNSNQTIEPYRLTHDDKLLIRGMNFCQRVSWGEGNLLENMMGRRESPSSNIRALYFDGPELAAMVSVHKELERVASERRGT